MNTPSSSVKAQAFVSARSALAIAQRAAKRPDNEAPGLPFAVKSEQEVVVEVFFLRSSGNPTAPNTSPPEFSVQLDRSGSVLKAGPIASQNVDALRSASADGTVGVAETQSVQTYVEERNRFLDISPAVWSAFELSASAHDPAVAKLVSEYWHLFPAVVRSSDAGFYLGSSPAFFAWVAETARSR